ncbi:phosphodiesterase [Asanoa sp. NPDC050611]|uniref:phosphodiesterase n=1 Tax=Asanoa sp. NPDC050611 TaxID=3157098 RepID=UPI0033D0AF58
MRSPLGAVFRALSRVRHGRAVHKVGRTFEATFTSHGTVVPFDRSGKHPALVRLSRGAGLPRGWPDVLGVAVRVRDGGGPGRDLDLLVSSALGRAPLVRQVPFPRRRMSAAGYTSIATYRTRQGRRLFAAFPTTSPTRLLVATASRTGRWRVAGHLDLGQAVSPEVDRGLTFDPLMRSVPGVVAAGLLWRLRATAYRESRRGRKASR